MTTNADNILERAGLSLRINVSPAYYDGLHLTGSSTAGGVQVRVSKSVLGWIPRSMVAPFVARFLVPDDADDFCGECEELRTACYCHAPAWHDNGDGSPSWSVR